MRTNSPRWAGRMLLNVKPIIIGAKMARAVVWVMGASNMRHRTALIQ